VRKILQLGLVKGPTNIFYGWWIVAVGFILDALKQGTFTLGFATYFLPIQRELGLTRTATSFAFTLGRLEGGLQGPIIGYLIDHLGPRVIPPPTPAVHFRGSTSQRARPSRRVPFGSLCWRLACAMWPLRGSSCI